MTRAVIVVLVAVLGLAALLLARALGLPSRQVQVTAAPRNPLDQAARAVADVLERRASGKVAITV